MGAAALSRREERQRCRGGRVELRRSRCGLRGITSSGCRRECSVAVGQFAWAPDRIVGPDLDATTEGGWLIKEYIGQPRQPLRLYLDAGVFEADRFVTGGAILESTRHFRDVLRAKGYTVTFSQFTGGHDYLSWRGTLAEGLIELIGTAEPR
jgi:hypothetical protein